MPKSLRSSAMSAGSWWLSSQIPSRPGRASSSARRSRHIASGTMMSPAAGAAGAEPSGFSSSRNQGSVATFLSLMMSAIDLFLERLDARAPHDVDEAFFLAVAMLEIDLHQLL